MDGIPRSKSWVLLLALTAACGGDDGMQPEPSAPAIAAQGGNGQSGPTGAALASPVVVRVTQDGSALPGVSITWTVTAGGGSVDPAASVTGADGSASTSWTLGPNAGANSLRAAASGATGSPVNFSATGTSSTPPTTAAVSVGDNFFDPTSTTIAEGGSVTWTWAGAVSHNVTFSAGANSATQTAGTFTRTFANAGSFDYLCTIHGAAMSGTVVVQ